MIVFSSFFFGKALKFSNNKRSAFILTFINAHLLISLGMYALFEFNSNSFARW